MKTFRGMWPQIIDFGSLYQAYIRARRGKRTRAAVQQFELDLEGNLIALQNELIWGEYRTGRPHRFRVYEPKLREVVSLPFRDRVAQHSLVAAIEPCWERGFIHDSYACRPGRGIHRCADRVQAMMRRVHRQHGHVYALKADVRQYFASIDHAALKALIRRKVACDRTLRLCDEIIDSWAQRVTLEPRGLPIGNLTSQLWANVYLDALDQHVKHGLRVAHYVRYMDDFVVLSHDKAWLQALRIDLERWLADRLGLELNHKTQVFPIGVQSGRGLDFVGYRIWPDHRRLRKSSVRRMRRSLKRMQRMYSRGEITLAEVRQSVQSWVAHASHADTAGLRESLLSSATFQRVAEGARL